MRTKWTCCAGSCTARKTIPEISCKIGKVSIPGAVIKQPGFAIDEGHHGVCIDGKPVAERRLDGFSLAHFPIRSIDQFTMRAILCRLAWSSRSDYNPSWGWHYGTFIEQLKSKPAVSAADLTEAALLYVDIYNESGQTPHQKVLVFDPVTPAYDRLRFTDLIDVAVLPPILDMMDALLGELREARNAGTRRSRLRELFRIGKEKKRDRPLATAHCVSRGAPPEPAEADMAMLPASNVQLSALKITEENTIVTLSPLTFDTELIITSRLGR